MKKRTGSLYLRMSAAFTAGLLMATASGEAMAGKDFNAITSNITSSVATLPNLMTTVAYLGGIGLGIQGVLKLKAHVDAPQQVNLKDGLVRLGAGGGLLALPIVLEAMTSTIGAGAAPSVPQVGGVTGFAASP